MVSKVIQYNRRTRLRLAYHWHELWRSLLGLLKFLVAKSEDLTDSNNIHQLATNLVDLLAATLAGGETFLPGTTEYDDLFYKLVQATSTLEKFSQICISPFNRVAHFIRFWETSYLRNDDTIERVQTLSVSPIRTSEDFQIAIPVFGGSYQSNKRRIRQHSTYSVFATSHISPWGWTGHNPQYRRRWRQIQGSGI